MRLTAEDLRASEQQLVANRPFGGDTERRQRWNHRGAPGGGLILANDVAAGWLGFASVADLLAAAPIEVTSRFEMFDGDDRPLDVARLPGRAALAGEEPGRDAGSFAPGRRHNLAVFPRESPPHTRRHRREFSDDGRIDVGFAARPDRPADLHARLEPYGDLLRGSAAAELEAGRSILVAEVTDDMLRDLAVDDVHLKLLRQASLRLVMLGPAAGPWADHWQSQPGGRHQSSTLPCRRSGSG